MAGVRGFSDPNVQANPGSQNVFHRLVYILTDLLLQVNELFSIDMSEAIFRVPRTTYSLGI
jgi:hypothetical protein